MPKLVVEEQKEFVILPADSIVHLKVGEMEVKDVDGRNGSWQKLEIKFKVMGIQVIGDGSPVDQYESLIASPMWGSVPFRLTSDPENKLRLWAEAILGMELGIGYELDTELFADRLCRGVTSQYTKRNGRTQHQVASLLPKAADMGQQQQWTPASNPWATAQQPAAPQGFSMNNPPQPGGGTWDEPPPF